jgi:hypothetical protein
LFSLPAGTEMFHFPAFPPRTLCVQMRVTAHDDCRVSPFGHPRITARLTAPRGLSRPPTSFIGSWCQGIHRAPLKTWPQMLASTMQFSNNQHSRNQHSRSPRTQQRAPHSQPTTRPFHAEAVLGTHSRPTVPNSQRSTHEQPAPDTRRCTGPGLLAQPRSSLERR